MAAAAAAGSSDKPTIEPAVYFVRARYHHKPLTTGSTERLTNKHPHTRSFAESSLVHRHPLARHFAESPLGARPPPPRFQPAICPFVPDERATDPTVRNAIFWLFPPTTLRPQRLSNFHRPNQLARKTHRTTTTNGSSINGDGKKMAPALATLGQQYVNKYELIDHLEYENAIPVFKYKCKRTGITCVFGEIDGPLVSGYFALGKRFLASLGPVTEPFRAVASSFLSVVLHDLGTSNWVR